MLYPWQPLQNKVTLKTDSDYAGTEDFRSTTCVLALHGAHYLMGLSVTQPLESMSVTESEFYAEVRGCVEGVYNNVV